MVKIEGPSEYDKLDALVHRLAADHGLKVDVTGWTRKTYELIAVESRLGRRNRVARVESFATTNGEVTVLDDRGLEFAQALAEGLEREFGLAEAVIRRG